MPKYRANLTVVEAVRLPFNDAGPGWLNEARRQGLLWPDGNGGLRMSQPGISAQALPGDWIVRLPSGKIRICEPDLFAAAFELIE